MMLPKSMKSYVKLFFSSLNAFHELSSTPKHSRTPVLFRNVFIGTMSPFFAFGHALPSFIEDVDTGIFSEWYGATTKLNLVN